MSADTPRQMLAQALGTDNPEWIVYDYPGVPGQVEKGRPVAAVWRSDVVPATNRTNLGHELTINLYGAKTSGAAAEDELDDMFDAAMLTLERFPGFVYSRGSRQSFKNDTFAGWQIAGVVYSPNHYRSTVIQERSSNGTAAP